MSNLITGAAGLIGSHLAEALMDEYGETVSTFHEPTIDVRTVSPRVKWIPLDVRDGKAVHELMECKKPDVVYHLAAQSLPTVSWAEPVRTMDVNIDGTINIFESVKKIRNYDKNYDPMIVVACSSAEYGATMTPDRVPIDEDAPLLPLHPYGVSKVAQDLLAFQYFKNFGIRCIRARIFNCTGPRKRDDVVSDFGRGVVSAILNGGKVRVGNLETRRAIIDVRDMVGALRVLARRGRAGEAYNICSDQPIKIASILDLYAAVAGKSFEHIADPTRLRPSDEPVIFGGIRKLTADTGWRPTIPLSKTVADVFAYELAQAKSDAVREAMLRPQPGAIELV